MRTPSNCHLGHRHRSTRATYVTDAIALCNKRTSKALARIGATTEDVCGRCARLARKRSPSASLVRECPGCHDKVCLHFFPLDAKVCYACKDGVS